MHTNSSYKYFRQIKCIKIYKTGHKCKYSESMLILKPDGNIYSLASCASTRKIHVKDESQSYVLLFLRGLRKGSYLSVSSPPPLRNTYFNGNHVQHFHTLHLRFVVRRGGNNVQQKTILSGMNQFCDEIFEKMPYEVV